MVAGKVWLFVYIYVYINYKELDLTIHTDELERVLKINVVGTFNVSKHSALQMVKQNYITEQFKERGVIVNVASVAGIEG